MMCQKNEIPGVMKHFKMACLSYQPNPVTFDNRIFERNQLLEAQGYLLYLSIQQLNHLDFGLADKHILGMTDQSEGSASRGHTPLINESSRKPDKLLEGINNTEILKQVSVESYADSLG